MAIVKVIELLTESSESWEDATKTAIAQASQRVRNIQTVYIEGFQAVVDKEGNLKYRVDAKVSFIVE